MSRHVIVLYFNFKFSIVANAVNIGSSYMSPLPLSRLSHTMAISGLDRQAQTEWSGREMQAASPHHTLLLCLPPPLPSPVASPSSPPLCFLFVRPLSCLSAYGWEGEGDLLVERSVEESVQEARRPALRQEVFAWLHVVAYTGVPRVMLTQPSPGTGRR